MTPAGVPENLKEPIMKGVAFHHSGLTGEVWEILERGFWRGVIQIIVATSTLSTGINLPAKAVIFNEPSIGTAPMN